MNAHLAAFVIARLGHFDDGMSETVLSSVDFLVHGKLSGGGGMLQPLRYVHQFLDPEVGLWYFCPQFLSKLSPISVESVVNHPHL